MLRCVVGLAIYIGSIFKRTPSNQDQRTISFDITYCLMKPEVTMKYNELGLQKTNK